MKLKLRMAMLVPLPCRLKTPISKVSYHTPTHVIPGVGLDSGLTMQESYEPGNV